jgi:hypothetical protein
MLTGLPISKDRYQFGLHSSDQWLNSKKLSPRYADSISSVYDSFSSDDVVSVPNMDHESTHINYRPSSVLLDRRNRSASTGSVPEQYLLQHRSTKAAYPAPTTKAAYLAPSVPAERSTGMIFHDDRKQPPTWVAESHPAAAEAGSMQRTPWARPGPAHRPGDTRLDSGGPWRRMEMEWDPRARSSRLFRLNAGATVQVAQRHGGMGVGREGGRKGGREGGRAGGREKGRADQYARARFGGPCWCLNRNLNSRKS